MQNVEQNWKFKHGHAMGKDKPASPEYLAYTAAKMRCRKPNNRHYHRYGGRGIEFRFDSFPEFYAEIGPRPSAEYSLDRKNNDGHYEKGNLRWATKSEQQLNRSVNHHVITADGMALTACEWARLHGLARNTVRERLRSGWCDSCAVGPRSTSSGRGAGCPHR